MFSRLCLLVIWRFSCNVRVCKRGRLSYSCLTGSACLGIPQYFWADEVKTKIFYNCLTISVNCYVHSSFFPKWNYTELLFACIFAWKMMGWVFIDLENIFLGPTTPVSLLLSYHLIVFLLNSLVVDYFFQFFLLHRFAILYRKCSLY